LKLETGKEIEEKTLREIVEFMRTFADKCHNGKEETHLFPAQLNVPLMPLKTLRNC